MTDISSLFPLKAKITKKILDEATVFLPHMCIGALTLKGALGEFVNGRNIFWGRNQGYISTTEGDKESHIAIGTEEDIDLMTVTEERDITFVVIDQSKRKEPENIEAPKPNESQG